MWLRRVLSAEVETVLDRHNSSDDTKAEFNNYLIIHSK